MSFPAEFLEEIRTRLRVSEVLGKRLKLVKRGREFLGLCPFHNDSKPSLSIVDEKNFYHCFACGAHGDIIKFTMEIEGLSFVETVEKLSGMAGLEMPRQSPIERTKEIRRKTLREVLEEATRFFEQSLWDAGGRHGLEYLKTRGLSESIIRAFRLGFAPADGKVFRQEMKQLNISEDLLKEVGLIKKSEASSSPYDYFRNRLMFPIGDRRGQVIGFGGRTFGNSEPKYLNSPETSLFEKGRILYGSAQAREVAHKKKEILVVEGYMDVIALAEAGISNVVAPLGTALTEDQIRELWRLAKEPCVCFDGDEAGLRAAFRASERCLPILEPGYSLRFVSLSGGEDPDDIVRRGGANALRQVLDKPVSLSDFIWDQEIRAQPVDTPERQADLFNRIRNRVRDIKNRSVQEAYWDQMENKIKQFRFSFRQLNGRNNMARAQGGGQGTGIARGLPMGSRAAKSNLLSTMAHRQKQSILAAFLTHPILMEDFGEALGYLELGDPFLDKLRLDILDILFVGESIESEVLKDRLLDRGYEKNFGGVLEIGALAHIGFAGPEVSIQQAKNGVRELLSRIGKHQLEEQLATAKSAIINEFNEVNWNRLSSLRAALVAVNDGAPFEESTN